MFAITFLLSRFGSRKNAVINTEIGADGNLSSGKNPLEFRTAAIFGILFVVFALVTDFVLKSYGSPGLTSLAFVVGITDIDPFLLNLLQQKSGIGQATIVLAIFNATNSNNLLKMIYALSLSSKSVRKDLIINFSILIVSGLLMSIIFSLL
jgi:uncharacterized membrane protein (DUF4010 family)